MKKRTTIVTYGLHTIFNIHAAQYVDWGEAGKMLSAYTQLTAEGASLMKEGGSSLRVGKVSYTE